MTEDDALKLVDKFEHIYEQTRWCHAMLLSRALDHAEEGDMAKALEIVREVRDLLRNVR